MTNVRFIKAGTRAVAHLRRGFSLLAAAALLGGCFGPSALHHTLPAYDTSYSQSEEDLLLLNVARLTFKNPPHFTTLLEIDESSEFTSSAAARFTFPAGVKASNTYQLGPLAATTAEKPTFRMFPVQGDEFARRFESVLRDKLEYFIWAQGSELKWILPLMVGDLIVTRPGYDLAVGSYPNGRYPNHTKFIKFRDFLGTIENLHTTGRLHIDAIDKIATRYTPAPKPRTDDPKAKAASGPDVPSADDQLKALQAGYRWEKSTDGKEFLLKTDSTLAKMPTPSDCDFSENPPNQHYSDNIWKEAQPDPQDLVYVKLGGCTEGTGMEGYLLIRNFIQILRFLAEDGQADHLIGFGSSVPDGEYGVSYGQKWMWVPNNYDAKETFSLLYQLYQMTNVDTTKLISPTVIAIPK